MQNRAETMRSSLNASRCVEHAAHCDVNRIHAVEWHRSLHFTQYETTTWHPPVELKAKAHYRHLLIFKLQDFNSLVTYLHTYLLTYLLIPWSRVLLEKLTGFQLVKKFPSFYGTRRFITAFTSARHLSLSWASSLQSMSPHPVSWTAI